MLVEIWSDVVCPFCYLGLRRLQAGIEAVDLAGAVELRFRSFELDPRAPSVQHGSLAGHLARKYGMSVDDAVALNDGLRRQGEELGIDFRFDRAVRANTFDAHRVLHLAQRDGHGLAMKERLLRAYFTEGEQISDHDTLGRLAGEVGLEPAAVADTLAGDTFSDAVREDEAAATELGVTGVPFFLIDGAFAVAGAQPTELFERVLRRATAFSSTIAPHDGCAHTGERGGEAGSR